MAKTDEKLSADVMYVIEKENQMPMFDPRTCLYEIETWRADSIKTIINLIRDIKNGSL